MAFRPKMTPPEMRKMLRTMYCDDIRPTVVTHLCYYVYVIMSIHILYALLSYGEFGDMYANLVILATL